MGLNILVMTSLFLYHLQSIPPLFFFHMRCFRFCFKVWVATSDVYQIYGSHARETLS